MRLILVGAIYVVFKEGSDKSGMVSEFVGRESFRNADVGIAFRALVLAWKLVRQLGFVLMIGLGGAEPEQAFFALAMRKRHFGPTEDDVLALVFDAHVPEHALHRFYVLLAIANGAEVLTVFRLMAWIDFCIDQILSKRENRLCSDDGFWYFDDAQLRNW